MSSGEIAPTNRLLGKQNDQEIWLKKGPYGFYFQLGEGKACKRSALPKFINPDVADLQQAEKLFALPLTLGTHPEDGQIITLGQGRFGPFIAYNQQYFSLPNKEDIFTLELAQALKIIAQGSEKKAPAKKKIIKKSATKK